MPRSPSSTGPGRRLKTISIGGATFDLFVGCGHEVIEQVAGKKVFALPLGEKVPVHKISGQCGGGASNTAVGLSRLGCDAAFIGVVGDDQWGHALLDNLKKHRVDTSGATIVEHETSSFSIVFNADGGERVIVYNAGTNEHLHDVTFPKDILAGVDWVYLNHLHERSCVIQDDLIEMLVSGEPRMAWNPGGSQIRLGMKDPMNAKLLQSTDILLLNKEEALAFTGTKGVKTALQTLIDAGVGIVCVTDGKNGAMATDGKQLVTCPNAPATVVDTTGAGDGFGTGLVWAIASGFDLPTALRAASINGASVVSVIGAQPGLLTDTDMRRKLQDIHLDVQSGAL